MNSKKIISFLLALLLIISPLTPLVYAEEVDNQDSNQDISFVEGNQGATTEEEITDEAVTDEAITKEEVTEEAITEEAATEEAITEEEATEEENEEENEEEATTEAFETETKDVEGTADELVIKEKNKDVDTSLEAPVIMRMIIPVEDTKHFQFYLSETDANNELGIQQTQIVRDGEVLQEPSSPAKVEGKTFIGWFYFAGTIEKQIIFNSQGQSDSVVVPVNQNPSEEVIKVYAKYEESFSVHFIYNGEVLSTKEVALAESFNDDGVIYFIDDEELSFKWWSITNNGAEFPFPATVSGDTTLYLVTKPSFKVSFDTMGGSSLLPIYVDQGDPLGSVTAPTKAGYDFGGWKDIGNTPYTAGTAITAPVLLLAQWSPVTVDYSVFYFLENAEDTNYTYEKTVNMTGPTGSTTNLGASTAGAISHFTFNNAENVIIEGDGSSIVRVYYKRIKYILTFKKPLSGNNNWSDVLTEQVKHGAKTFIHWDEANTNTNNMYGWNENSANGTRNVEAPLMHKADLTFYGYVPGAQKQQVIFIETLVVPQKVIKTVDLLGGNPTNTTFTGGRVLEGFTWKYVTEPGTTFDYYKWNSNTQKYDVRTYYERNKYDIDFKTYSVVHAVPSESVLYEKSLANSVPTELEIGDEKIVSGLVYEFVGWYKDPAFTDLFNFASENMPAHNINLHGKWAPKKHIVRYYEGIEGSELGSFDVEHRETISEGQLSGYTVPAGFKGWYRKDGSRYIPFIVDEEEVLMDMDLYPILSGQTYQALYKDSAGDLINGQDLNEYTSRARAIVKDYPGNLGEEFFIGWLLEGDTSGKIYNAGDSILMNSNKTFTPLFGDPLDQTKIIYNAGDGLGSEKIYNVAINSKHTIKTHDHIDLGYSRLGYEFTGWKVEGSDYLPGQDYLVDDEGVSISDYSANTFVAQWRRIAEDIIVTKQWVGGENARPDTVTLILLQNNEEIDREEVSADQDGNWSYTWVNQQTHDDNGEPYIYTADEVDVDNFIKSVDGLSVMNSYESPTTDITATKQWVDGENALPDTVTLILLQNNAEIGREEVSADGDGNWFYTWSGLDVNDSTGTPYNYTADEVDVDNFNKSVDGLSVMNSYESPTTDVTVNKLWIDGEHALPDSVTLILLRNNVEIGREEVGADEDGNWSYTWKGLDENDSTGTAYNYTADEADVENFDKTFDGLTVINTYVIPEIDVTGTKVWEGGTLLERPTIQLQLYKNGKAHGEPVTLVDGETVHTWKKLDMTDSQGLDHLYTVEEVEVPESYEASYSEDGRTVINTYVPEMGELNVRKVWVGNALESVTIHLFADGKNVDTVELSKTNDWKHTFTHLLTTTAAEGKSIEYTIEEVEVDGYKTEITVNHIDGFTVTNTEVIKPVKPVKPVKTRLPSTGSTSSTPLLSLGFALLVVGLSLSKKKTAKRN